MKYLDQSTTELLNNRLLFEEIHQLKATFINFFAELANDISLEYLLSLHDSSQGAKISKGNELEHCPYQVLDIVRDFDKDGGFNIRILNWWGRGLFVMVFMGRNNQKLNSGFSFVSSMQYHGYLMAKTSSPWDYKRMIDEGQLEAIPSRHSLNLHLDRFKYLQLVKKIDYTSDFHGLKRRLKGQVDHILKYYGG